MTDAATHRSADRFLEMALTLFAEHGYAGTSLQMIGDGLGVTKAAVTYHFRAKSDLLVAILTPLVQDMTDVLDMVSELDDNEDRRTKGMAANVDMLMRHRRVLSWISRDVGVVADPAMGPLLVELGGRIERLWSGDLGGPLVTVWGSAISDALIGAVARAPQDFSDDQLRTELQHIGDVMIAGVRDAHARHGLELPLC